MYVHTCISLKMRIATCHYVPLRIILNNIRWMYASAAPFSPTLLPKDINVLATTAASRPTEPSWGTYCKGHFGYF